MVVQKNISRLLLFCAIICAAVAWPLLSRAQSSSITIVNNSQQSIHHLYLSPVDKNEWGPDQLGGATINSGSSYTLNDVSCSGPSIKVISEDQNGCFLSYVASCAGNSVWTINNDATPDCGN
jgi:hypothetical protein